ncbi:unnamed protein product, partial [Polarella glacialis]
MMQTVLSAETELGNRGKLCVTFLGMLGCSLMIGDGAVTPAISVLGALEGIPVQMATSWRVAIAVAVLLLIFGFQRRGSRIIGTVAGPITVCWFLAIAALGIYNLIIAPDAAAQVVQGLNPLFVYRFFVTGRHSPVVAWRALAGVVLCVTGAEALYADLGHFGRGPISFAWFGLAYPCLILQYMGQSTVLIAQTGVDNPFWAGMPQQVRWPMLVLATLAACIASQAMITGVFSLVSQAHALQLWPRILVLHTNPEQFGEVYVPELGLVVAAQYGHYLAPDAGGFGFLELQHLEALSPVTDSDSSLVKISTIPVLQQVLLSGRLLRADTAAVFLTPQEWRVPRSLGMLAVSLGCLPKIIVLLSVRFEQVPFVVESERVFFEEIDSALGLYRVVMHFGYAEPATAERATRRTVDSSKVNVTTLQAFENELGVQVLQIRACVVICLFAADGNDIDTEDGDAYSFKRRRSVEIKHGQFPRGYITPEVAGHFPGYLSFSEKVKFADIPNGLAAISKVPGLGWFQIIAYAAFCEINAGYDADINKRNEPGNMGWRPPLLSGRDPEARKRSLASEIANGRLAMMATIGMLFQDGLTGSAWGDWANYVDSPLRAFESELGVQAPFGFWDPAGLAKDGDVATFARRRSVELKHGRIAMLATMGYITPEVAGKFPGYLDPQAGLKFTDVPNGLAAISKVPAAGWTQILLYMAFCEVSRGAGSDITNGRPGDFGFYVLTSKDPAEKAKKLNAELANGRLAMMAIIGMFFQDGLTGAAWGDWANYTDSPLRAFEGELGVQ